MIVKINITQIKKNIVHYRKRQALLFIILKCSFIMNVGLVVFIERRLSNHLLIALISQIDGTANTTEYGYAVIKNVNDFNCVLLFQG